MANLRKIAAHTGLSLTIGLGSLVAADGANAGTASSTMAVSAVVQSTCQIMAKPLAFGTYSSGQLDGITSLMVSCTNTTPYNVGLDVGSGSGATVASRKLANGADTLNYSVYSDPARSKIWGSTVGTDTVAGTGTGTAQTLLVYGSIPAGQMPTPGSYTDTVTATVSY